MTTRRAIGATLLSAPLIALLVACCMVYGVAFLVPLSCAAVAGACLWSGARLLGLGWGS